MFSDATDAGTIASKSIIHNCNYITLYVVALSVIIVPVVRRPYHGQNPDMISYCIINTQIIGLYCYKIVSSQEQ